ncbi:MAG: hypothetical protein IJV00_07925 [Clostridia bacterium]|nr:hypothetical protein [Clostridia bacterium]
MRSIKRFTVFLLAVLLAFSLLSCGDANEPDNKKSPDKTKIKETAAAEKTKKQEPTGSETAGTKETAEKTTQPGIATVDVPVTTEGSATVEETAPAEDLPYVIVDDLKKAAAGDVIVFGEYEQDGDASNGKEPLEWLVLENEGDDLLVITLYGVEHGIQFHSSLVKVTWETSAVREWLNGSFIGAAFSASERERIKTSTLIAEKNPDYPNSPAGGDTEDKVFLLSVQEAQKYFSDNNARKCSPTDAAIASEPAVFSQMSASAKAWYASHPYGCSWWLRSPGMYKDLYVSYVGKFGDISGGGQVFLSGTEFCVRPAMRIAVG